MRWKIMPSMRVLLRMFTPLSVTAYRSTAEARKTPGCTSSCSMTHLCSGPSNTNCALYRLYWQSQKLKTNAKDRVHFTIQTWRGYTLSPWGTARNISSILMLAMKHTASLSSPVSFFVSSLQIAIHEAQFTMDDAAFYLTYLFKKTKHHNALSSQSKRDSQLPVSATPTLNSCPQSTRTRTVDPVEEGLAARAVFIREMLHRRQKC